MPFKSLSDTTIPDRMIISTEGERGSGKTTFSLSAAASKPPVYIMVFDAAASEGALRAAKEAGLEDSVSIATYDIDPVRELGILATDKRHEEKKKKLAADAQGSGSELLDQFTADYTDAVKSAGTTVVTTGTDLYELIRLSWFGKLSQVPELAYPSINAKFHKFINEASSADGNLIVEHKLKEEYSRKKGEDKGEKTGRLIRSGASGADYDFQVMLRLYRKGTRSDPARTPDEPETGQFFIHFLKSNLNSELVGLDFPVGQLDGFDSVGKLIFGEDGW